MTSSTAALRRMLLLLVLVAGAGVAISRWRVRLDTPVPAAPPQWPDLPNAERRAPAPTAAVAIGWVPANADGSAPASHPIKAKESSGIFHVPGGRFYDRTNPDRCYATVTEAEADGYRRSKS